VEGSRQSGDCGSQAGAIRIGLTSKVDSNQGRALTGKDGQPEMVAPLEARAARLNFAARRWL
jgi:hypothetical protein